MTIYRFPFPRRGLKNPEPNNGSGFFTLDNSVDGFALLIGLDVGGKDVDEVLASLEALPAHVGGKDDIVEVVEGIILQLFLSLTITHKLTYNNTNKIIHFIHIL